MLESLAITGLVIYVVAAILLGVWFYLQYRREDRARRLGRDRLSYGRTDIPRNGTCEGGEPSKPNRKKHEEEEVMHKTLGEAARGKYLVAEKGPMDARRKVIPCEYGEIYLSWDGSALEWSYCGTDPVRDKVAKLSGTVIEVSGEDTMACLFDFDYLPRVAKLVNACERTADTSRSKRKQRM